MRNTNCIRPRHLRSALLLATLSIPLPALAVNKGYIGPDGGLWSTSSNWVSAGFPLNGDSASLLSNTDKTILLDVNYGAPGLLTLDLDGSSFATVTLSQPFGTTMRASTQEHVGYLGRGRYLQTGGDNITPSLTLGLNGGSYGTYDLSGGNISPNEFWIGYAGTGVLTQTGGSVSGGLAVRLGATSTGNGTYILTAGSLNTGYIENGAAGAGYVQHQGGAVTLANLFNGTHGTYNFTGGSISLAGSLFNDGPFSQSAGSFSGNVTNNSGISVSGGTFTVNSGGMTNNGQFSLYGGALQLNGASSNQGYIQLNGNSTISGVGTFTNYGTISQGNGIVFLSGAAITNLGNIQLALASALTLSGANFTNNGTINLNGGRIGGFATLTNRYGATITGNGLISALFDNQGGRLLLTDGTTLITNSFVNSGIIQLTNDSASLGGGGIANTGEVTGHGSISNFITNSTGGMIESGGGTLILGGGISNGINAILSAPAASKLFLPGGLATNGGLINLSGGAFDNNAIPLSNTGQISGFGSLRTGGTGLTNNGSITFTGGFTTVNGNVTNAATKQIKIAYNPALFTGNVVNNGTFKTTSTTTTFSGSYTENGTFISDPSDQYFMDVFMTGTWTGGVGDRFFVKGVLDWTAGSMSGSGAQTFNQGSANLHDVNVKTLSGWTFNNEKPLTLSGGNINMGNTALINNTNTFDIQSDAGITNSLGGAATFANHNTLRKSAGAGSSIINAMVTNDTGTIDVQSGTLDLQGGLSIAAGTTLQKTGAATLRIGGPQPHGANSNLNILAGTVRLASNAGTAATGGAGVGKNVSINLTGTPPNTALILESSQDLVNVTVPFANPGNQSLDLNTPNVPTQFNALRIYSSDLAATKLALWSAIKNANGPGSLTPTDGIYDSGARGANVGNHANTGIGIALLPDAHGDSHVQVRLAKIGDLNFDNTVSISDFIDLAAHFNQSGPTITWQEGDLNYDGSVSISDFIDLAAQFNTTYSADDVQILASFASSIGVDPSVIGSAVPEPGTLGLISIAATACAVPGLTRRLRPAEIVRCRRSACR